MVRVFPHCGLSSGERRGCCGQCRAEAAGGSLRAREPHTRLAQSSRPDRLRSLHSIQETGREQKMDGALDRHKVAIIYGVPCHRNWYIF